MWWLGRTARNGFTTNTGAVDVMEEWEREPDKLLGCFLLNVGRSYGRLRCRLRTTRDAAGLNPLNGASVDGRQEATWGSGCAQSPDEAAIQCYVHTQLLGAAQPLHRSTVDGQRSMLSVSEV